MADLYTKNGRPLHRERDDLFSRSGKHVARLSGNKAFSSRGRYVGTLVGDRLIYRSTDSAVIGSLFTPSLRAGYAMSNAVGTAEWGDEPPIDD
jgi:hypothetical protein